MIEGIREVCVLSIFCGAALSICPEGGAKRVLRLLSTAALLALILNSTGQLDLDAYPLELARYHEREQELTEQSGAAREQFNRLVIEREYASYIEDKAAALGIDAEEVRIAVRWSAEGLWVPESSSIRCPDGEARRLLGEILEADLGIASERQEWGEDG